VRVVAFNIRHGGGSRIGRIEEVVASHEPDILILPEFRNNAAGEALRGWLREFGHRHQAAGITSLPAHNTVLVTARVPLVRMDYPALGAELRRCVVVRIGKLTLFAVYFAVMEAKRRALEIKLRCSPSQTFASSWLRVSLFDDSHAKAQSPRRKLHRANVVGRN
jgi:hypothetical protein